MSTKIYEAYRIRMDKVPRFTSEFRGITFKDAVKQINNLISRYDYEKALVDRYPNKDAQDRVKAKKNWEKIVPLGNIFAKMMYVSDKGQNDPLNFDTSFNLWIDGKWAYIIPYFGCLFRENKLILKMVEGLGGGDYCYYNNTDMPEGISRNEWKNREITWERVCLDSDPEGWNRSRYTHVVIEGKSPYQGFYKLEEEVIGKDAKDGHWITYQGVHIKDDLKNAEEKANQEARLKWEQEDKKNG